MRQTKTWIARKTKTSKVRKTKTSKVKEKKTKKARQTKKVSKSNSENHHMNLIMKPQRKVRKKLKMITALMMKKRRIMM